MIYVRFEVFKQRVMIKKDHVFILSLLYFVLFWLFIANDIESDDLLFVVDFFRDYRRRRRHYHYCRQ